jgi:hypothetical protein
MDVSNVSYYIKILENNENNLSKYLKNNLLLKNIFYAFQAAMEQESPNIAFLIDSTITPNCLIPNEGFNDYTDPNLVILIKLGKVRLG